MKSALRGEMYAHAGDSNGAQVASRPEPAAAGGGSASAVSLWMVGVVEIGPCSVCWDRPVRRSAGTAALSSFSRHAPLRAGSDARCGISCRRCRVSSVPGGGVPSLRSPEAAGGGRGVALDEAAGCSGTPGRGLQGRGSPESADPW